MGFYYTRTHTHIHSTCEFMWWTQCQQQPNLITTKFLLINRKKKIKIVCCYFSTTVAYLFVWCFVIVLKWIRRTRIQINYMNCCFKSSRLFFCVVVCMFTNNNENKTKKIFFNILGFSFSLSLPYSHSLYKFLFDMHSNTNLNN